MARELGLPIQPTMDSGSKPSGMRGWDTNEESSSRSEESPADAGHPDIELATDRSSIRPHPSAPVDVLSSFSRPPASLLDRISSALSRPSRPLATPRRNIPSGPSSSSPRPIPTSTDPSAPTSTRNVPPPDHVPAPLGLRISGTALRGAGLSPGISIRGRGKGPTVAAEADHSGQQESAGTSAVDVDVVDDADVDRLVTSTSLVRGPTHSNLDSKPNMAAAAKVTERPDVTLPETSSPRPTSAVSTASSRAPPTRNRNMLLQRLAEARADSAARSSHPERLSGPSATQGTSEPSNDARAPSESGRENKLVVDTGRAGEAKPAEGNHKNEGHKIKPRFGARLDRTEPAPTAPSMGRTSANRTDAAGSGTQGDARRVADLKKILLGRKGRS